MHRIISRFLILTGLSLQAAPLSAQTDADAAFPNLADTAELECLIRPSRTVRLGTPVGGIVATLNADRGDWVNEGDVVVELNTAREKALLKIAEARAADQSTLRSANERATYLKAEADRLAALNDESLLSDAEAQEAKTELQIARSEADRERVALKIARHERDNAKAELDRRIIKSPVTGVVTERNFVPGEYWPEQEAIVTIAAVDTLHVETFAGIDLYGTVQVGDTAIVRPQPPISGTYEAEVTVVDSVFDAASSTFDIRLSLPNPDRKIPAGIKCTLQFGTTQGDAATLGTP